MNSELILNCILLIALTASTIFSFTLLGLMKFLCQVLKIRARKFYIFSELRYRLLSSIGEGISMALLLNIVGIMGQVILVNPIVWRQWFWSTIMTWILWFIGAFAGKTVGIAVFGKNICGETEQQ